MTTETKPATGSIVLVTTADTDILTAERALVGMPWGDSVTVHAFNPVALEGETDGAASTRRDLLQAVDGASVVVLRLLGGRRALGDVFDPLWEICLRNRTPLIACPGHQEWDDDLVAACTAPVSEVETVFSYLMRGGVLNFRNLFLFLADTYLGATSATKRRRPCRGRGSTTLKWPKAFPLPTTGLARFAPGRPSVAVLFYRAHWMSETWRSSTTSSLAWKPRTSMSSPCSPTASSISLRRTRPAATLSRNTWVDPDGVPVWTASSTPWLGHE